MSVRLEGALRGINCSLAHQSRCSEGIWLCGSSPDRWV